jgi:hypothetical protein
MISASNPAALDQWLTCQFIRFRPQLSRALWDKKSGQRCRKTVDPSDFSGIINNVNGATDGANNNKKNKVTNHMGSKSNRGPGRPAKFVELNNTDIFSLKDAFALNPDTATLTVRKRVNQLVESGVLTRLNKTAKTGGRGKPAALFVSTKSLQKRAEARLAEKAARQVVA